MPHPKFSSTFKPNKERLGFQVAMLTRFLFSCLVDADYRDTEAFYATANGETISRGMDQTPSDLAPRLTDYLNHLRATAEDKPLNHLRRRVLEHARERAALAPGVFSLTVPTGGGKTLTSLAFAMEHAKTHGLDRIIYAIPFTSIIDQTAQVFRDILGDGVVLEHHTALDRGELSERDGADKLKLAMEDWDAPLVVTTTVQFFESLFSHRPARCRKLHNVAHSVIILDEAQTLPLPVLRPCVAALDELARNHGCSIVLCTATQPALGADRFDGGLENVRELAPDPGKLQKTLTRTTIRHAGLMSDTALIEALGAHQQALVIVNSRAHALALYRAAQAAGLDGVIHLSTRQVAADRQAILVRVRETLAVETPCRVIATSLVEAGVDVDFPVVFRAEAGLDSILQAAGRCNREGRRAASDSPVMIFEAPDWPAPRAVRDFAAATRHALAKHPDPATLDAIKAYFEEVYWRKGANALDRDSVLERFVAGRTGTDFAFRSVGETFHLIADGLDPVIIPRNDNGCRMALDALPFATHTGGLARALQRFTVQIPPKDRDRLMASGQVNFRDPAKQFAVLEDPTLYTPETGLIWEEAGDLRPSESVW
ncbi:CRISPR-associated endonuclease/helicase Cas3 [Roseospira marina]|nr:CRISPR-associated endonuclease/helicase Cas3 [Roseospira marina]